MTYSLGIVQSHVTQFDGPLFRKLASRSDINLTVYFTRSDGHQTSFDPELNHKSGWDRDIKSGFVYHSFPSIVYRRIQMCQQIASAGHDLVIVAGYSNVWLLLIAILSNFYRTPIGLRADSVLLYRTQTTWKWRLKDIILPKLYRLYTTMHPVGTLARDTMRHYGFRDDAIFFFPYTVDSSYLQNEFATIAPQRKSLREAIGIKPNDKVILGVLKFIPREDPLTLVYAYTKIAHTFPNTHLILVGSGELQSKMEHYIVEHHLEDRIHLPGYVPYSHLPRYFAMADVLVHPAKVEPWGVTVNEAMVCGLPVIAADTVGSAYDLVQNKNTGFMFESGNPESLAKRLSQFLGDSSLHESMRKGSTTTALKWSYDMTVDQILQALKYVESRTKARAVNE
mgnify:CR=1 FL=1